MLLQELESFNGVVIFATNLAANFDPAFERRIRSHVLFEMPGVDEREQIWRVQMHPTLTPLADDVDFRSLAETYDVSGGDIRNAVLRAALMAAAEPGHDASKAIHQRHLDVGIRDVISSRSVMRQSLFDVPESRAVVLQQDSLQSLEGLRRATVVACIVAAGAALLAIAAVVVASLR